MMFKYSVHKNGIAPCMDCPDRVEGCHSVCKRYKEWSVSEETRHEQVVQKLNKERAIDEYEIKGMIKRKRGRR